MTVRVSPLNALASGAAGGAGLTQFSDNFNRGDGGLGRDWTTGAYGIDPPITTPLGGPLCSVFTNACFFSYEGSANPNSTWLDFAIPIKNGLYSNLYGRTQFCQFTFVNFATTASVGLGVCMAADQNLGYFAIAGYSAGPSQFITLYKLINGGTPFDSIFTALATVRAVGPAGGFQTGEVWRINVDQSGTDVVINVFLNGVLQTTFTDNTGTKIRAGSPGLIAGPFNLFTQSGNIFIDNFSCGLGL